MPTLLPVTIRTDGRRRQRPDPFERQPQQQWDGPQRLMVLLALVSAGAAGWSAATLPPPLLLPLVSVLLVAMAIATGGFAWMQAERRRANRVGYWDIAGALALIGIVAALLGDPEQVIPLLESRRD